MTPLLDRATLNEINRELYPRGATAVFYKVTPEAGEIEIGSITQGFTVIRQSGSNKIKMLMANDAGIDREDLRVGAEVELTLNGRTARYSILELEPMQQLGAGYAMRLDPLQGATG